MAKWKQTNTHSMLDHGYVTIRVDDLLFAVWELSIVLSCKRETTPHTLARNWVWTVKWTWSWLQGGFPNHETSGPSEMFVFLEGNWMGHSQFGSTQSTPRPTKTPWNSGIRTPHGQVALVVCPWQLSPEIVDGTQRLQKVDWPFPPIVMEVKNGKSPNSKSVPLT